MGLRGPRPTPKATLNARGSWRAKLGGKEPAFTQGTPRCPAHLKGEARKEWKRVTPELEAAGLLAVVDRAALAAYCQAWARWVEGEEALAKSGPVLRSKEGGLYLNPYLSVVNKAMEQLRRFLIEFGLSPSARARVNTLDHAKEADQLDEFIQGAG